VEELTETVRAALGRSIVDRAFEGAEMLQFIGLAPELENRLQLEMGEEGEAMISPELIDRLPQMAEWAMARQVQAGGPMVLLVSPALRPALSRILRRTGLMVLSYAEIPADKSMQIVTQMQLSEAEHAVA
jgi:flagellar biosynthesis protein FlhA